MHRLLATIIVAAISISGGTALADTAVGLEMTTSHVGIVDGGRSVEGDISSLFCSNSKKEVPLSSNKISKSLIKTTSFGNIKLVMGSNFSASMSIDPKYRESLKKFCGSK